MAKRLVSVEIEYDGDECGRLCPFLSTTRHGQYCTRFVAKAEIGGVNVEFNPRVTDSRCDECKAEDAPSPWDRLPTSGGLITKIECPKEK